MTNQQHFCKVCFHDKKFHVNESGACLRDQCDCEIYRHGETRVTSSTGAEKGTKEARYDLIPVPALDYLARLYGKGAEKYSEHNWRLGYNWSLSYSAAQRHMAAFWSGEDLDPETQVPHVINAAFHMFALATFLTEHPELDDRFETNQGAPEKSFQEIMSEAIGQMSSQIGSVPPVSFITEEPEVIQLQKKGKHPLNRAARKMARQPEGTHILFSTDFTDEEIAKVFDKAAEIQKDE